MKTANLARAGDADVKPYTGTSAVFVAPQRITSPTDSRWRKELEIGKCTVSDFDLVWCIDSTGSMNEPNQIVRGADRDAHSRLQPGEPPRAVRGGLLPP
jgi:hypothetical protein